MRDLLLQASGSGSDGKADPEGASGVPSAIGFYYLCLKNDILPDVFEETRRRSETFDSQCRQLEAMRQSLIEEKMYGQALVGGALGKDMVNLVARTNPEKFGEKKAAQAPLVIQIQAMRPEQVQAEVVSVRGHLAMIEAEDAEIGP